MQPGSVHIFVRLTTASLCSLIPSAILLNRRVHRIVSLTLSIVLTGSALAEAPFNLDQTPGKLPKDVIPERYDITIAPSIEKAAFTGSVTVDLKVRMPVKQLVLNSLGLTIRDASL